MIIDDILPKTGINKLIFVYYNNMCRLHSPGRAMTSLGITGIRFLINYYYYYDYIISKSM